jgi:hypothetical protein
VHSHFSLSTPHTLKLSTVWAVANTVHVHCTIILKRRSNEKLILHVVIGNDWWTALTSATIGHTVLCHLRKDFRGSLFGNFQVPRTPHVAMLKFKRIAKDHGHSQRRTRHHDRVAYLGLANLDLGLNSGCSTTNSGFRCKREGSFQH